MVQNWRLTAGIVRWGPRLVLSGNNIFVVDSLEITDIDSKLDFFFFFFFKLCLNFVENQMRWFGMVGLEGVDKT